MNLEDYNDFCASLPHTTHVVQWGGAHVWKVADKKVFAIGNWQEKEQQLFVTFKVSPLSYELLKEEPGCRPAPYLATRGMKWIQHMDDRAVDDASLKKYLTESHHLARANLTKKLQKELGFLD